MPTVVIPVCFLERAKMTPDEAVCRVEGRTVSAITRELFQRYPALVGRFKQANGEPELRWFALYREGDNDALDDLRETPAMILGEDERIHLINLVGC